MCPLSVPDDIRAKEDLNVRLATVEQIQAFLSTAAGDSVKAIIPLDLERLHSADEKGLHGLLSELEPNGELFPVSDEALDDVSIMSPTASSEGRPDPMEDLKVYASLNEEATSSTSMPTPLVAMVAWCALALVAMGCIALGLYICEVLKRSALQSMNVIFPHIQKALEATAEKSASSHLAPGRLSDPEKLTFNEKKAIDDVPFAVPDVDVEDGGKSNEYPRSSSGIDNQVTLQATGPELRECLDGEKMVALDIAFDKPILPSVPPPAVTLMDIALSSTTKDMNAASEDMSIPGGLPYFMVQELSDSHTSLSMCASEGNIPGRDNRRRYGQFTAPGIDAALAMQLRPGFGASADGAWLVRFVMALFGWCAVLMSGAEQ